MKLIVITSERFLENEASAINELFKSGLQILHLRKPFASLKNTQHLLKEIESSFQPRIVLHDHFLLTEQYNLKGIHLNKRNPQICFKKGLTVSRSCHSLEEITMAAAYDYLFLSPVFDSISKTGYQKRFEAEQLEEAKTTGIINERIIALGGITSGNIPEIRQYGFGCVAVLGTLWTSFEKDKKVNDLLRRFNELKTICEEQ